MVRDKVEYIIHEEEMELWGTRIRGSTSSPQDQTDAENPKKQKDEWEIGVMEEGEHVIPFEVDLPAKSLPSSIDVTIFYDYADFTVWKRFNNLHSALYTPTTTHSSRSNAKQICCS